ncbi:hypothetical protein B0H11DRAFT_1906533 [Mycena galericulata]|nr:hypothetical protein B0H11DRAFT_1906533 [Mycena galericulata]
MDATIFKTASKPTDFLLNPLDITPNFAGTAASSSIQKSGQRQNRRSKKVKEKEPEPALTPAPRKKKSKTTDTLKALANYATVALRKLKAQEYPNDALECLRKEMAAEADERDENEKEVAVDEQNDKAADDLSKKKQAAADKRDANLTLGKAYSSYTVVFLLHKKLPHCILSRGTLTVLRGALLQSSKFLKVLVKKFKRPAQLSKHCSPETFFQLIVASIALSGSFPAVEDFFGSIFNPIITAICAQASSYSSLHKEDKNPKDPTGEILKKIYESSQEFSLKRRYSPGGKENGLNFMGILFEL